MGINRNIFYKKPRMLDIYYPRVYNKNKKTKEKNYGKKVIY